MATNEAKAMINGEHHHDGAAHGGAASGSSGSVLSHADANDTSEGKSTAPPPAPEPEKKPMGDRLAKIKARQAREAAHAKPLAGTKRGSDASAADPPHMEAVGRKSKIFRPTQAPGAAAPIKPPPVGPGGRICLHCHTQKTPLWRNGPLGPKTLCNACGVRYKLGKLQPNPNSSIPAHLAVHPSAMGHGSPGKQPPRASPAKKKPVPRAARTARGSARGNGGSSSDEDDVAAHRRASWGGGGGGGAGMHHGAHMGRVGPGGDPEPVCAHCEDPADEHEPLARCAGLCARDFHPDCLSPADAARLSLCGDPSGSPGGGGGGGAAVGGAAGWKCSDCRRQVHECFHCKQRDPDRMLRRCAAPGCGKFYHPECLEDLPLARAEGGGRMVCPLHTCAGCGDPARARECARCVRCPQAFHLKCLGSPGSRGRHLTRHHLVCEAHGPPAAAARAGGGTIGLFDYSDHTAAMLLMALAGVY